MMMIIIIINDNNDNNNKNNDNNNDNNNKNKDNDNYNNNKINYRIKRMKKINSFNTYFFEYICFFMTCLLHKMFVENLLISNFTYLS